MTTTPPFSEGFGPDSLPGRAPNSNVSRTQPDPAIGATPELRGPTIVAPYHSTDRSCSAGTTVDNQHEGDTMDVREESNSVTASLNRTGVSATPPPVATGTTPPTAHPQNQLEPGSIEQLVSDRVAEDAAASVTQRYLRYLPVVQHVYQHSAFRLDDIHLASQPERPAFVTRLINELVTQGWLSQRGETGVFEWNQTRGSFSVQRWLDEKLLGSQVKNQPQQERPRERLMRVGPESLRLAELLAILIRTGRPGESAVEAGEKMAKVFHSRLERLPASGRLELKAVSTAIDVTAYCQIMAGIELGRRVADCLSTRTIHRINSTDDAIQFCQSHFRRLAQTGTQEEFHIVTLDTKNQVLDTHRITVGTLDSSLVHPREVFKAAIKDSAAVIILVHNHPSGDPTPSRADQMVTERLVSAGQLLGIKVLDHIIVGHPTCLSLRANGDMA